MLSGLKKPRLDEEMSIASEAVIETESTEDDETYGYSSLRVIDNCIGKETIIGENIMEISTVLSKEGIKEQIFYDNETHVQSVVRTYSLEDKPFYPKLKQEKIMKRKSLYNNN